MPNNYYTSHGDKCDFSVLTEDVIEDEADTSRTERMQNEKRFIEAVIELSLG